MAEEKKDKLIVFMAVAFGVLVDRIVCVYVCMSVSVCANFLDGYSDSGFGEAVMWGDDAALGMNAGILDSAAIGTSVGIRDGTEVGTIERRAEGKCDGEEDGCEV